MMKDSLLENRLNAIKEGRPIPSPSKEKPHDKMPAQNNPSPIKQLIINESYKIFQILLTSFLYGIGIGAIFAIDWSIIQILGVGILANHILSNFFTIISKPFKK